MRNRLVTASVSVSAKTVKGWARVVRLPSEDLNDRSRRPTPAPEGDRAASPTISGYSQDTPNDERWDEWSSR